MSGRVLYSLESRVWTLYEAITLGRLLAHNELIPFVKYCSCFYFSSVTFSMRITLKKNLEKPEGHKILLLTSAAGFPIKLIQCSFKIDFIPF